LKYIGSQTYGYGGVDYAKIKAKFAEAGGYSKTHKTTQGIDRTLRRLEQSGLITRPRKGFYKITKKGKSALYDLQHGLWRN